MKLHPKEIYDLLLESSQTTTVVKEVIIGLTWTFCRIEGLTSPLVGNAGDSNLIGLCIVFPTSIP
jgi:hypothetical protein